MSSSVELPSPDDDYSASGESSLTLAFWNAALNSVGQRIRALEAVKASWEDLIAIGTGQALEVIAANVEPQLAELTTLINALKADVAVAQDAIAAIVVGSVPASSVYETDSRIWLTPALRDAWNGKQPGDPTLSALAALNLAQDKLIYATGTDTFALATISAFAREVLASATSANYRQAIAAAGAEETDTALSGKASKDIKLKVGTGLSLDGQTGTDAAPANGDLSADRLLGLNLAAFALAQAVWNAGVDTNEAPISPAKVKETIIAAAGPIDPGVYAVSSYTIARTNGIGVVSSGGTLPGGNMQPAVWTPEGLFSSGGILPGSWRNVGGPIATGGYGIFQRIV